MHLLLAFPLFVVVVGVDPRWLLHSLEQHSVALQTMEGTNGQPGKDSPWQSTPLNYLEKIFQIPYTLRPLNKTGFEKLVDALSKSPDQEKPAAPVDREIQPQPGSSFAVPQIAQVVAKIASQMKGAMPQVPEEQQSMPAPPPGPAPAPRPRKAVDRNPSHLRIEDQEREFMKLLHEFIPSPRAGKRFINIYRLLRASVEPEERASFIGDGKAGDYQAALLLLAILTGYPEEATELFRVLLQESPQGSWWEFALGRTAAHQNGTALRVKLEHVQSKMQDRPCNVFERWAGRVARYSFQSGRVVLSQSRAV